jgi:SDR family mycofactocin-dependent oxidoreductase
MTGRVAGKVALITGAARGQGRSHALRLAEEGADIIALDFCTSYDTIAYPMATLEDLEETARLVEKFGRRVLTVQVDVRDFSAMHAAVQRGLAEFGTIDIVVANAGICATTKEQSMQHWADVSGVDLVGVLNTVNAVVPSLVEGASIIVTGSLAALLLDGLGDRPGDIAYAFAKQTLVGLVRSLGKVLAPRMIRLNGVHPTNCNTDMLQHAEMYEAFRPDLANPTRDDAAPAFATLQSMPVPWVEPSDISNTVLFLASEEARYITGQFIGVDAGALLKIPV